MEMLRRNIRDLDFTVFGVLLLLAAYGTIAVDAATHSHANPYIPSHIMVKQIAYEIVGIIALLVTTVFDYRVLRKYRWWLYGFSALLLLVVFGFPATSGAHSWINLKVVTIQPSELAKIALIIWLAAFMAEIDESEMPDYRLRKVWMLAPIVIVPFALTFEEPALGQALVIVALALTMYTVFAKRTHFAMIMLFVVIIVFGFSVAAVMFPDQSEVFINHVIVGKLHLLKSYQASRITTWLDPNYDVRNDGYNVHMAQIAIGSGQLFGEGLFNGIETKGAWVPNQWTDYIFSAVGEEFGFVGAAVLVLLFLMLMYRLIKIAATTDDYFGMYMAVGIIGMFSFQVFENIGMDMYLSPSTGITLPFISYGGTSLVVDYIAVGLVLSVGVRRRKLRFD